jgi:hypothetical protein
MIQFRKHDLVMHKETVYLLLNNVTGKHFTYLFRVHWLYGRKQLTSASLWASQSSQLYHNTLSASSGTDITPHDRLETVQPFMDALPVKQDSVHQRNRTQAVRQRVGVARLS